MIVTLVMVTVVVIVVKSNQVDSVAETLVVGYQILVDLYFILMVVSLDDYLLIFLVTEIVRVMSTDQLLDLLMAKPLCVSMGLTNI